MSRVPWIVDLQGAMNLAAVEDLPVLLEAHSAQLVTTHGIWAELLRQPAVPVIAEVIEALVAAEERGDVECCLPDPQIVDRLYATVTPMLYAASHELLAVRAEKRGVLVSDSVPLLRAAGSVCQPECLQTGLGVARAWLERHQRPAENYRARTKMYFTPTSSHPESMWWHNLTLT